MHSFCRIWPIILNVFITYYNSLLETIKVKINCPDFMLILSDETIVSINKVNCLSSLGMLIIKVNHRRDSSFSHSEVQIDLFKPYLTMVCTTKEFTFTAKLVRHMMVQLSWWAMYLACRNKFQECIHSLSLFILKSHIKSDFATNCAIKKSNIHTFFSPNLLAFHHFFDTHCALMPLKNLWKNYQQQLLQDGISIQKWSQV